MFKFLRKRVLKEHMILVAQNFHAHGYCRTFMSSSDADYIQAAIRAVNNSWRPGQRLAADQLREMLDVNMRLRRAYDASPARFAGMKKFDDQFVPLLGWKEYCSRYLD